MEGAQNLNKLQKYFIGRSQNRKTKGKLEGYMKLIEDKDKLTQITEDSLKNIMKKSDRTSLELVKYFQIERIKIKNQQEGRFIPSGKVYMIQKGTDPVFVPRPDVHTHCNPWRILRVSKNYFKKEEIFTLEIPTRKYRKPKLRENYFKKDEIFTLEIPTRKYRKLKLRENVKERNTNWCEENKLKKLIVLNYTERGKQQES